MSRFVNRDKELDALRNRLGRPASFSLVYGQRRVGKTFLLQKLLEEEVTGDSTDSLYFLADESTAAALLRRFQIEVSSSGIGGELWAGTAPSDWGTALSLLAQSLDRDRRTIIVIDEFQYLLAAEPALPSILQRIWDTIAPRGGVHFILCGSALGTLARLGDQQQPLHGRFDLRLKVRPFTYLTAAGFISDWSPQERLRAYGVFGGLARHLAEIDPQLDLATNASQALVDPLAPLHEAPLDLLRTERVSAHASANAILTAVAAGEDRFNAIASRTGLTSDRLAYVLDELIELEILIKQHRSGDRPGSRFVRYRCADPLTTFWFRHIQPQRSALAGTPPEIIWKQRIAPRLEDHMGAVFESVVKQALEAGILAEELGPLDEIAPWWSRDGQTDLDWVARFNKQKLLIECKWRATSEVGYRDLERLAAHADRANLRTHDSKLCLATAGTFSPRLQVLASDGEIVLLSLSELFGES